MENHGRLRELLAAPREFLHDPDPALRRLAVSCLPSDERDPGLAATLAGLLNDDPADEVRAAAAERLGDFGEPALEPLLAGTGSTSPTVAEAAVTALGELAHEGAVDRLIEVAGHHPETLVREAAVAALGEIGSERALPVIVDLLRSGPPQVRRRAVVAATVFIDGPKAAEVEIAISSALDDRNPMVREAAEMAVGRPVGGRPGCE